MAAKTRNGVRPTVGRREVIVMTISIYNKGCSRLALLYDEATKTNDGLSGLKSGCKGRHFVCHGGYNGFNLGIKRVTIRLHGAVCGHPLAWTEPCGISVTAAEGGRAGRQPSPDGGNGCRSGHRRHKWPHNQRGNEKKHGERKKNKEKDCRIVFSFYIWAFLSKPGVLRNCAL